MLPRLRPGPTVWWVWRSWTPSTRRPAAVVVSNYHNLIHIPYWDCSKIWYMATILWLIWSLRISYPDYSDLDHESLYPWYVTLDHTFLRLLIFGPSIAGRALFTLMASKLSTAIAEGPCTVDSNKTEQGCRMIFAGFASSFGLGIEEGQVPTFWLLLEVHSRHLGRKWVVMSILWAPAMYSHGT